MRDGGVAPGTTRVSSRGQNVASEQRRVTVVCAADYCAWLRMKTEIADATAPDAGSSIVRYATSVHTVGAFLTVTRSCHEATSLPLVTGTRPPATAAAAAARAARASPRRKVVSPHETPLSVDDVMRRVMRSCVMVLPRTSKSAHETSPSPSASKRRSHAATLWLSQWCTSARWSSASG